MTLRQQSIAILKQAVKDKTLGCYKGATECLYYDEETDSKCAVGAIIPQKTIDKMKNDAGNCKHFIDSERGDSVHNQLKGRKTYRGMKISELGKLQRLHDNIILNGDSFEEFENYVNSLK